MASIHTGSRSTKRAHAAFGLLSEELAPGVGPELFHHIKQGIKANLLSPLVGCVTEGAVLSGIVEVRNTSGDGVSGQLRCIELVLTVVATCDDFATDSIPGSLPEATFSLGEVTGLPNNTGERLLTKPLATL